MITGKEDARRGVGRVVQNNFHNRYKVGQGRCHRQMERKVLNQKERNWTQLIQQELGTVSYRRSFTDG